MDIVAPLSQADWFADERIAMSGAADNRFQDFFEENRYVLLKNHLYNYLLRKHAIEQVLYRESYGLILETGSGISPVMTKTDRIVYSELSFLACRTLKNVHGRGAYVVADATRLPFRDGAFTHTVCSEVLEHIEDDRAAIRELARVMPGGGRLILTFPHRRAYFANDDRYVNHFRRYEYAEMVEHLREAGLVPVASSKVLGPLEKITMMAVVLCFEAMQRLRKPRPEPKPSSSVRLLAPVFRWANLAYAGLAWLDARIVPRAWATVVLILAEKR